MPKHVLNEYDCGCTVVRASAGGFLIEWCKLHEAASKLLAALKDEVALVRIDGYHPAEASLEAIKLAE